MNEGTQISAEASI